MKLRHPAFVAAAAWLGVRVIRGWTKTLRTRTDARGQNTDPWDPNLSERFIYALWHESFPLKTAAPMAILISQSRDGELLSRIAAEFGVEIVRGSSSQGGVEALDELVELSRTRHLLITADGPRGPRRVVKRGLAYLASRTGRRIVPMGGGFSRAWRANSWDRTAIPKPGSVLTCVGGPIIAVPPNLGKRDLENYRLRIEQALEATTIAAEDWARGRPLPPLPVPMEERQAA